MQHIFLVLLYRLCVHYTTVHSSKWQSLHILCKISKTGSHCYTRWRVYFFTLSLFDALLRCYCMSYR